MKKSVESVAELGLVLRAVRKSSGIRIDDLAGIVGVSKQFASDVENGKETVQMGRVLRVLSELGVRLSVEFQDSAAEELHRLEAREKLKKALFGNE